MRWFIAIAGCAIVAMPFLVQAFFEARTARMYRRALDSGTLPTEYREAYMRALRYHRRDALVFAGLWATSSAGVCLIALLEGR